MSTLITRYLDDPTEIGESLEVDFENSTWKFKMKEGFTAGAGSYHIVKVNEEYDGSGAEGFAD